MSSYQGQLVDKEAKDFFDVSWDGDAYQWTVTASNETRSGEAKVYAAYLSGKAREYSPGCGPFLRYCLWHLERDSRLKLKDGLPEEPEGTDPSRVY
jgi:hypothetical protein